MSELSTCQFGAFAYGVFLKSHDISMAYKLAELGVKFCVRYPSERYKCFALYDFGMFCIEQKNVVELVQILDQAFQSGLACGEQSCTAYACCFSTSISIISGFQLDDVQRRVNKSLEFVTARQNEPCKLWMKQVDTLLQVLKGAISSHPSVEALASNNPFVTFINYFFSAIACYFLEDYEAAYRMAVETERIVVYFDGLYLDWHNPFWQILIRLAYMNTLPIYCDEYKLVYDSVIAIWHKFRDLASLTRVYLKAQALLAEAHIARYVEKKDFKVVVSLYESAIDVATSTQCQIVQALATQELATYMYENGVPHKLVGISMTEAINAWHAIGISRCAVRLQERFRSAIISNPVPAKTNSTSTFSKAVRISQESTLDMYNINIASLFANLMPTMMQQTNAERGVLVIPDGKDTFLLYCESRVAQDVHFVQQNLEQCANILCLPVIHRVANTWHIISIANALVDTLLADDAYVTASRVRSIVCAPVLYNSSLVGIIYLENTLLENAFSPANCSMLQTMIDVSLENARLFTSLNSAYSRFFPREFLQQLGKPSVVSIDMGDCIEKQMTVLFADLRNFTNLTDSMSASESFKLINQVMNLVVPVIYSNGGFVDKYLGDGIMSCFPVSAASAVQAALGMIQVLQHQQCSFQHSIRMGIGIHYGKVMLGTVGCHNRLSATVISNTVNLASRLENMTKVLGANIIVSQDVVQQLVQCNDVQSFSLGKFVLKGYTRACELFEIATTQQDKTCYALMQQVLHLFEQSQFESAMLQCKQLAEEFPSHTKWAAFYQQAIMHHQRTANEPSWSGEIRVDKEGRIE